MAYGASLGVGSGSDLNKLRILFVADGRSAIALNWIAFFVDQGHEVHLASTFPCAPDLKLASLKIIPVAFSQAAGDGKGRQQSRPGIRKWLPVGLRTALRQRLGPLTLSSAARQLSEMSASIQPDLVHAMRIPYEGMLAAMSDPAAPLLVSIWGNDFTLHAPATPQLGKYTRQTLQRADALHADCHRDIRLAREWGFSTERPYRMLPGGGGIQLDLFYPPPALPAQPVVINPRGFRAYIRNDVFFRAIPEVLAQRPEARFLCINMAHETQAQIWRAELGVSGSVDLLPAQSRPQMAELFRQSQVVVSPSTHDGTPNTFLEAIVCGCFPVVGDLESLREWIDPGENGLLVDPGDPHALAEAILFALDQPELRQRAASKNFRLVEERAEYQKCMHAAESFYLRLMKR